MNFTSQITFILFFIFLFFFLISIHRSPPNIPIPKHSSTFYFWAFPNANEHAVPNRLIQMSP